ncbi:hypothetical protein A4A49_30167 [Nicotiana attenuata]|uniref:Uncharacterized protein n=1 Tax=Nicotiana attenuata TaxID=49451 RepID=A0A1J6KUA6_NICAT|nr:hypothetical protein A4A49_30167 [Nicotiana attenuata]
MQQVIEDQGMDADNNKGNNFLVVHQGFDANKLINTPAVIRSSNGTIPRENTTAAVLSAEANPTTAAGKTNFQLISLLQELWKQFTRQSKATAVALAVTAAPVAKPSTVDQVESTVYIEKAMDDMTTGDRTTVGPDNVCVRVLDQQEGIYRSPNQILSSKTIDSNSFDALVNEHEQDVKETGNMKQQIGDEERLITGLVLSPSKSGHVTTKDPVVVGGTTGPVTRQKAKEVGHQNLKGQVQQQVRTAGDRATTVVIPQKVAHSASSKSNAQLMQFLGCNKILGEQQAIQPAQGVSGQQQLSHT